MISPLGGSGLRRWLGAALGPGFLRPAPGSWGSLATVLVLLLLLGTAGAGDGVLGTGLLGAVVASADGGSSQRMAVILAIVLVTVLGVLVGNRAREDWGVSDPSSFVLDEVAGQLLPFLPLLPGPVDPLGAALAFGAFRLFDIVKPPPIRQLERLPGGVGIMADDLGAGLVAMLIVALLF